jgi:hypothetical protein
MMRVILALSLPDEGYLEKTLIRQAQSQDNPHQVGSKPSKPSSGRLKAKITLIR